MVSEPLLTMVTCATFCGAAVAAGPAHPARARVSNPRHTQRAGAGIIGSIITHVQNAASLKLQYNRGIVVKIGVEHLNFYFGPKRALADVSMPINEREITALIGP